ncbi:amino acid permease [Micromonospora sp. LZ34]
MDEGLSAPRLRPTDGGDDAPVPSGQPLFANLITVGTLAGLTTVVMILMLGQSRVAFAMSRDGLLPRWLSRVHPRYGTPHRITVIIGLLVAALAGFIPLEELAELVNIGTLFAFVLVAAAVILLRRRRPDLPRGFRVPWGPVIPALAIVACVLLMLFLTVETWLRFLAWRVLGWASTSSTAAATAGSHTVRGDARRCPTSRTSTPGSARHHPRGTSWCQAGLSLTRNVLHSRSYLSSSGPRRTRSGSMVATHSRSLT